MNSRYVMANIEMPIEITANNEICPLQNLSSKDKLLFSYLQLASVPMAGLQTFCSLQSGRL